MGLGNHLRRRVLNGLVKGPKAGAVSGGQVGEIKVRDCSALLWLESSTGKSSVIRIA